MKQKCILLIVAALSFLQLDMAAQRNSRYDYDREHNTKNRYDQKDRKHNDKKRWDRTRDNRQKDQYQDDYDRREYACRPMNNESFYDAINTIKNTSFDNTKLEVANSITSMNCLTSDQILTIAQLMSFESSRLSYAKNAYTSCADPQNYFRLMDAFTFSSSKEELSDYISRR